MANFPELVPHLSDLRKACGLTRDALSEKTGIAKTYITKYENGTLCPYGDKAESLAAVLGVSTDELIGKYNTRLWSSALEGAEDMDRIHGTRSLKQYVSFMRPIVDI